MNYINVAIQNLIFLTIFMGNAILALVLVVAGLMGWTASPGWILIGAALYLAGSMAVTFAINVPMNNALAAADSDGTSSETLWVMFLDRWVFWSHLRAAACSGRWQPSPWQYSARLPADPASNTQDDLHEPAARKYRRQQGTVARYRPRCRRAIFSGGRRARCVPWHPVLQ